MVETVDLIEVDVIHAEPTQAVVDLGEDRLPRKPGSIGAGTHPAINLGGDHDLVAACEILDRAAEDFLAVAERIAVSSVMVAPRVTFFFVPDSSQESPT